MGRLIKAILFGAAATGATYLIVHAIDRPGVRSAAVKRDTLLDEDDFTPAEKDQLLRELSSLI